MPVSKPVTPPEPTPLGGKGFLGCLGLAVLLIILGFVFQSSEPKPSSLTPEQREELSRLVGNYEGMSTPQGGIGTQWASGWTARFTLNESNRLKCECVLTLYQKPATADRLCSEIVDVRYQDSEKPGYVQVAAGGSSNKERWSLYVESPVLKSGKEITTVLLHDKEFGDCVLSRQQ